VHPWGGAFSRRRRFREDRTKQREVKKDRGLAEERKFSHLVVIGSSAGGIEALSRLVSTLPEDLQVPIVIAQHLDPDRASHLEQILSRRSTLPVRTVSEHEALEAGVIFVVPANRHVNITDSEIDLRMDPHGRPMPSIDLLFSSAADSFGERLIAIILSGIGSDGTEGARVVSKAGGVVIIQDPETAAFGDMPGSLAPNTVDIVAELQRIGPVVGELVSGDGVSEDASHEDEKRALEVFLEDLRDQQGMDFSNYKRPTIMRRLRRRMIATETESIEDYVAYLDEHPEEYRQLVNTFLIKVTEFFRDPDLFEYLREEILPRLADKSREQGRELRIWSAGCATGEEAYSLAILISEVLSPEAGFFNVRIFATDVDEEAINFARQGIYPASALSGLSEEQIRRYFVNDDGQYQVKKAVRGMIVFGEHDLARRSPFPRIDLVVSRNVLIYFTTELQRRALQLFAYSLRDGGHLVLGKAESISPLSEFFAPEHLHHKVYRRQGERFLMPPTIPASPMPVPRQRRARRDRSAPVGFRPEPSPAAPTRRSPDENLLNQLPVGVVVVDKNYDIQTINAAARHLLSIRGAAVGEDLLHSIQDVPYAEIKNAIDQAFRDGISTTGEFSIQETRTGETRYIQLICNPQRDENTSGLAVTVTIVVNDVTEIGRARREAEKSLEETNAELERFVREAEAEKARRQTQSERLIETNRRLEEANRELAELNAELQSSYEEAILTAEEAQAATEEVETLNEELQATNEELETLNEELQATIEELNTTNDDLQARTAELQDLSRTSEEERGRLRAILESIPEAVLVVDASGRTMLTNAAYGRLFGETDFDALDNLGNALAPDETPQTRVAGGDSFTVEFFAVTQDDTRRHFRAEGRPIDANDGRGGVIIIREVEDE
jgi:two-component system CheB/CheR fusion protein